MYAPTTAEYGIGSLLNAQRESETQIGTHLSHHVMIGYFIFFSCFAIYSKQLITARAGASNAIVYWSL